jgi:formylglycine-generating enzyme required for sulfatase activity
MPGKEDRQTAVVVEKTYDFLRWLLPKVEKFYGVTGFPVRFRADVKGDNISILPRRTFQRRFAPLVALVIGLCAVNVRAQAGPPYSKDQIVGMLKGEVSPKRVTVLARQRGINFQITSEVESELRRAGATTELLATLREIAPNPSAPQIETPRRVVSAPAAGTVRENPKDGLKYDWIPPGTFMMGCSPGDNECAGDEKPPHRVTLTKGFWMGQTPVTVAAYRRFAGSTGTQMPPTPDFNAGWSNQDMPIVNVNWNDATAFCEWAGGRLPTEAEWEYAARAGSTGVRYGPLNEVAWNSNNSGGKTHEVAQKRPNAWNLYDMLGNVWEWVNDWFGVNYYPVSPERDPRGPYSGQLRVPRGGSWYSIVPGNVRVSKRGRNDPAFRNPVIGFRCGGEVFAP